MNLKPDKECENVVILFLYLKQLRIPYIGRYIKAGGYQIQARNRNISQGVSDRDSLNIPKVGRERDLPQHMGFSIISKTQYIPIAGFTNQQA